MNEYIITVFGKKGYGKSSWIYHYIKNHTENMLVFIYDHFNEYNLGIEKAQYHDSIKSFFHYPVNKRIHVFRGEISYDNFFNLGINLGNCLMVFDEIDRCCSAQYISEPLRNIIHYGRHIKNHVGKISTIRLISASRRPANVSRDLTSQTDRLILFRIDEPRDVNYVREYSNDDVAERMQKLGILEYIEYPQQEEKEKNEISKR